MSIVSSNLHQHTCSFLVWSLSAGWRGGVERFISERRRYVWLMTHSWLTPHTTTAYIPPLIHHPPPPPLIIHSPSPLVTGFAGLASSYYAVRNLSYILQSKAAVGPWTAHHMHWLKIKISSLSRFEPSSIKWLCRRAHIIEMASLQFSQYLNVALSQTSPDHSAFTRMRTAFM